MIPSRFIGLQIHEAEKLAPHLDAFITQCQQFQDEKHQNYMRDLARAIRKKNPKCLVGAQLGVGVPSYGPQEKAVDFYLKTRDFLDLYSVWWGNAGSMVDLLKRIDDAEKTRGT
jgi:hypothetical protein